MIIDDIGPPNGKYGAAPICSVLTAHAVKVAPSTCCDVCARRNEPFKRQ
ncbi:hypothetical protein KL953_24335 [Mycolicibacterium goodii]|nr:hypothetical protein [Mycolicibacterium goodii]MBU8812020.1 hypothetical protein [Mycolicibacterium goodii]